MRLLTLLPALVPRCRALVLSTLLIGTASVQAGFFSSNFDEGQPPEVMTFGTAFVDPAGGVGGSGALRLTELIGGQMGTVYLTELDSQPITGFTASFKLLIGGGSSADGFSFNVGTFFIGELFGEEGVQSALTISFDTYDNGGGEAPAIDIRQWGQTIFSLKGNMDLFRTGDFIDVLIHAKNNGTLDLTVNGLAIVTDLPAAFPQTSGSFAFGARTGGQVDNHIIDDLTITTTTTPSPHPTLVQVSPRRAGTTPQTIINASLLDGAATQIDPSSIELRLNGTVVPATVFYTNIFAHVFYNPPAPLISGGDYTVTLKVSDTGSPALTQTFTWNFQVVPYRGPNGHLYEVVHVPWGITWDQANLEAQNRGFMGRRGHLVTINGADEDAFVELARRSAAENLSITEVWAGGFQQPGLPTPTEGWSWVNNEGPIPGSLSEPGYSNWLVNEPNDFSGPDSENYLSLGLFGQFGWNDSGFFGSGTLFGYIVEYDSLVVAIDVKPTDPSNTIQLKSNGKIPVAIFGSTDVNASSINVASVRAGRTGIEAAVISSSISDVNGDGHLDLVANFNLQDLELACGDMQLHLTGNLSEGSTIRGSDRLNLLGCPPYSLAITALQDVQRRTELQLAVNTILPGFWPPTNGTHLQLKSFNLVGNLSWTKNIQPVPLLWNSPQITAGSVWLDDALHLQPLRAKLQVLNSKSGATENLYAETRVLNRPDLSVSAVNAPAQVNVRQLFNVVAEIRELNGDLDGSGTAYLLQNGVVLAAAAVSVQAGGNAGVVFSLRIGSEGIHELQVRVANSALDYDPSNNEKSISVEALPLGFEPVFTELQYQNSYSESSFTEENEFYIRRYFSSYRYENFYQTYYIPASLSFPVSLASLRISADGTERFVADVEIPLYYSDVWDCFRNDYGYVFFDDGLTLNAQSVSDCFGFQQSYVIASRFSYDQLYYSVVTPKDGGLPSEEGYQFGTGVPWSATQNITTRLIVQDESGTFGGTASADLFNVYDYFNPFNYEVDGTVVIGHDLARYDAAFFSGMTDP
jgi:hypothetical protein